MGMPAESQNAREQEWREVLARPQIFSVDYIRLRNGDSMITPLGLQRHLSMATPHTSHYQYSEIETTKRKTTEHKKIKPVVIEEQVSSFRYPHKDFAKFAPNIRRFYRFPKARLHPWQ